MMREALEAADFAITAWEARIDRAIGVARRRIIERYATVFVIALPVAWIGAGERFNGVAWGGIAAGVFLYAAIDMVRRLKK